jgi:NAD(P)-dependent dehydrogenase (short-subunit alcohol dehydrogenase family)
MGTVRQREDSPAGRGGRLGGKVALITGGASGIGRAAAVAFAAEGATVVIADIQDGSEVVDSISAAGGSAVFQPTDATQAAQVASVVRRALDVEGRIDVLLNSVGVYRPGSILDSDEDDFDITFTVNVKSHYLACQAVLPHMLEAESGSIVNLSSNGGIMGRPGDPIYCASKHAIIGLTRALAVAYAASNVRVNALCPGPIDTPMLRGVGSGDFEAMLPHYLATCPAARVGHAEEVAAAALFLASDESRFITGAALPVDGGKAAGSMPADRYRLDFTIRR